LAYLRANIFDYGTRQVKLQATPCRQPECSHDESGSYNAVASLVGWIVGLFLTASGFVEARFAAPAPDRVAIAPCVVDTLSNRAIYFSEEEGAKGLCPLRGAGCPHSFFSSLAPEGGKKRKIK